MSYTTPGDESRRGRAGVKPFQTVIGREFEGIEQVEAKTRAYLVKLIVSATVVAALLAGGYGFIAGDFTPVVAVWSVAGPMVGALVTYYFGPQRNGTS